MFDYSRKPVKWQVGNFSYKDGAEWADKHPRKGLWDEEKVCKLLANMLVEVTYLDDKRITEHYDKYEFIEDFKQSMRSRL